MKGIAIVFLILLGFFGLMYLAGLDIQGNRTVEAAPADIQLNANRMMAEGTMAAAQGTAEFYRAAMTATVVQQAYMQQTAAAGRTEISMERTRTAEDEARRAESTQVAAQMNVAATGTARAAQETVEAERARATSTAMWGSTQAAQIAEVKATNDMSAAIARSTAQAAQAEIAAQQAKQEQIKTEREDWAKYAVAALPFVLIALAALFGGVGLREWGKFRIAQRAADGSAPVLLVNGKVILPDRSFGPVIDASVKQLEPPVEGQYRITENEQKVQAARALALSGRGGAAGKTVTEIGRGAEPVAQITEPQVEPMPELAAWSSLGSWRGSGALPLGIGAGRVGVVLNLERTPHLMVAGTSNSGKTMEGLRPVVALALASGWQVILMNDAGGDFAPVKGHGNLVAIEGGASVIADVLEAASREVNRRDQVLKGAGASTWGRMENAQSELGPRTMIVLDELVALVQEASGEIAGRIWRALIHITSKGRKMGLAVVFGTTDPTYRTLGKDGLTVRDNCGRMIFRVRDGSSSQAALNMYGAELLTDHHFLAQLEGSPVQGAAFHPSDEELRAFLTERNVALLPVPAWLTSPLAPPRNGEGKSEIETLARLIEGVWLSGGSKRAMARAVGGEYAGAFAGKIDAAIAYLERMSAATTPGVAAGEGGMG